MALTFPLDTNVFLEVIIPRLFHPRLLVQQELGNLASGAIITKDLGPSIWSAEIETKAHERRLVTRIQSLFHALHGGTNTFKCYSRSIQGPLADPKGLILGAATPRINSAPSATSVTISGLTAGYVINAGDRFSYPGITSGIGYHEFLEGGTANGSGLTGTLTIAPEFTIAEASLGSSKPFITLIKPYFRAIVVPGSLQPQTAGNLVSFKFNALQVEFAL